MLVDSSLHLIIICIISSTALAQDLLDSDDYKCGQALNRRARNETGVFPSPHGSSPWHASIYKIRNGGAEKWRLVCGGTILTNRHVITAAQCVFVDDCTPIDPKPFRVVVGQIHQSYEVDPDAQFREISVAKVHPDYAGENFGYTNNVALLLLNEPLIMTDYAMPICINRDKKSSRQLPGILEASGWSIDSSLPFAESLKESAFMTEDNLTCRRNNRHRLKYINFDKFCMRTPRGEMKDDRGTGLIHRIGSRYYLKGVLSEPLDKNFSLVTFIFFYHEWLKATMIRIEEEKKYSFKDFLRNYRPDNGLICMTASFESMPSSQTTETLFRTIILQIYWVSKFTFPVEYRRGCFSWRLQSPDSDKKSCTALIICEGKFACRRGPCIDKSKVCDRVDDCPDGYDEEDCDSECVGIVKIEVAKPKITMKCVTPTQLGGATYNLVDCNGDRCAKSAGSELKDGDKIHMTCGRGTAPTLQDPVYICNKGTWFPTHPLCEKLCTLITKRNLKIVRCDLNRAQVDCTQFVRPGTSVTYECERLYKLKQPLALKRIICLEGGRWSDDAPDCTPECGIKNNINHYEPTISYGTNTTYGEYPWHVALYGRPDPRTEHTWNYRCGGTLLLYPNVVLTAAHCVYWDEFANNLMVPNQLLVAAGKIKRNLYANESSQQIVTAEKIIPHSAFEGLQGQSGLGNDIALVILKTPFRVTDFVLPCCMGDTFSASYVPNLNGTVVGWGFTEIGLKNFGKSGILSDLLLYTQLPLVSNQECQVLDDKAKYIAAPDKFCGLYMKDSGPQRGDSGGGLVIPMGQLYYVIGVVSSKPKDSHKYGTFTSVGSHNLWLVENILANQIK